MKHLYLLGLACLAGLTLQAATPAKINERQELKKQANKNIASEGRTLRLSSDSMRAKQRAISKAPSKDYILGDYEVDYWDSYNERAIYVNATITAGEDESQVYFNLPIDLKSMGQPVVAFPATYEDGVLTFTSGTPLSIEINGRTFYDDLFVYKFNDDGSYDFAETATAVWAGYGFDFDADDILCMADPKDEDGAWFAVSDIITEKFLSQNPDFDINEGWTSLGNAHLQDGWVLPGFLMDQFLEDNIWEVELQQNDADPNVYRLVEPYKGNSPIADLNESQRMGFIQFDVTYPDYVTFYPVDAGFAYADMGIQKFYCQNFMTYMVGFYGDAPEDIVEEFDSPTMQWGNFKDGIVHLPYFIDGDLGPANDAMFGYQGKIFSASNWTFENPDFLYGEPANMDTKIYFPGTYGQDNVDMVKVEDNVRYYNLQGQAVALPSKGEIVIKIENGKSTKTILK